MKGKIALASLAVALLVAAGLVLLVSKGAHSTVPSCGAACDPMDSVTGLPAIATRQAFGNPDTSGQSHWPRQFDVSPLVHDLDGDGDGELIVQAADSTVHVFDSTGRIVARLPTPLPAGWHVERVMNGAAAGVLEPGQTTSLVITNHAAYVSVWRVLPHRSHAVQMEFEKVWEQRMDGCYWNPGMDAKASLADLTGDGRLEILVQTEEIGFFALRADGTTLWHHCWAGGNSAPVVDDLDMDGRPEVIVASDNGLVSVLDGATGAPIWSFDAAQHVRPGAIPVDPTVAQLDGEGEKEILFTARAVESADPATWPDSHMAIFAIHRSHETWQGELLWMRQPEWANPLSYTRLAVLDVDGDGIPEVFGMDWNTVGHFPGNWERLGPAHAFRLDAQGNDVWVRPLDTWWSNKDIAIGDADGDGRLEMLVNGPAPAGFDSIVSLDVQTGEPLHYLGVPGWQVLRGVTLADLRGDGRMQAIFPVSPAEGDPNGVLLVFELNVPYNAPWNGSL